jgi:hypothetical protein
MSIEFNCGQCGRLLRTGDDTAGRMAQCPECGAQTQVPISATTDYQSPFLPGGGERTPDSFVPESAEFKSKQNTAQADVGPGPEPGHPANTSYALQRIAAPATCLIVTSILGLAFGSLHFLGTVMNVGAAAHFAPREFMPELFVGPVALIQSSLGIIMSVVVLAGSVKMKGLDNYGFSLAAAILAIIPCTSPCCFLGLPFGIWALVVLSDPIVKSSFKS